VRARFADRSDLVVLVVTFTRARNLAGYRRRFAEPLTVVTDEPRELYRLLGLGRGSVARVWGWRSLKRYAQLIRAGGRLDRGPNDRSAEDLLQLGGNAVVDANGRLAWVFRGSGPDDRPSTDDIDAAIERSK
jgi:hypothetical protein